MTVKVETINIDTLPADEVAAIRLAEKEAADFYGNIEAEENENLRMEDLWKSCSIMVLNPIFAIDAVTAHLEESGLFTTAEKEAILKVATVIETYKINGNAVNYKAHSRAYDWTHTVTVIYKGLRAGHYTNDATCTTAGLIARIK